MISVPNSGDVDWDPNYAFELGLQFEVDNRSALHPDLRNHVSVNRIEELYRPVMVRDSIDVEAGAEDWVHLLTGPSRRFFALTKAGVLRTLIPRDAMVSSILGSFIQSTLDAAKPVNTSTTPAGH
jgi:hypothetical protein